MIWLIYCTGLRIFRVVAEPRNSGKSANSYKIHKNLQNTVKFGENLIKYMSVQHIWNLFQLLVLFTCCKRANLSWNFVTETCKQRPETTRSRLCCENLGTIAMMLKALPLVHFLSVLLLKEQMITSVKKKLNWPFFTDCFLAKFALKFPVKFPRNRVTFLRICS